MLGFYENFPQNIHRTETFTSPLSKRKLQQKITQVFQELNCKTFSFEEVANPTVPECTVIFEFGIADTENFCYLTEAEAQKLQKALDSEALQVMDWFCSIRYYKNVAEKRTPLKFDYYMLRMSFGEKGAVEVSVFHERGPRYISPEDLVEFIEHRVNKAAPRKILKGAEKS
jgi:hypothetical protein